MSVSAEKNIKTEDNQKNEKQEMVRVGFTVTKKQKQKLQLLKAQEMSQLGEIAGKAIDEYYDKYFEGI